MTAFPDMMSDGPKGPGQDTSILTKPKPKTERPPLYKVLLLNDDYTPMEFVVHVLERFFGLNHAQAFEIMLTVHKKGGAKVELKVNHTFNEEQIGWFKAGSGACPPLSARSSFAAPVTRSRLAGCG